MSSPLKEFPTTFFICGDVVEEPSWEVRRRAHKTDGAAFSAAVGVSHGRTEYTIDETLEVDGVHRCLVDTGKSKLPPEDFFHFFLVGVDPRSPDFRPIRQSHGEISLVKAGPKVELGIDYMENVFPYDAFGREPGKPCE